MDINYYQKAFDDFAISLKLNENNSYAYFYRGSSSLFLGKYMDAISDYNTVLKFDSLDFDAMIGLALCYFKIKDVDKTKFYLEKANNILSIEKNSNEIENYKNTYWFQNQNFYFNENLIELSKL